MTTITTSALDGLDFSRFALPQVTNVAIDEAGDTILVWTFASDLPDDTTLTLMGSGLIPVVANHHLTDLEGGVINSLSVVRPDGDEGLDLEFTDMTLSAVTFFDLIVARDWKGLKSLFFGGNDSISGTGFDDTLLGFGGSDRIFGAAGEDRLSGGFGADTLAGGRDADQLTGGAGADRFVFNTALAAAGVDEITDFAHGSDHIALNSHIFANVGGVGPLLASRFHVGPAANQPLQGIVYVKSTGELYSDADGNGPQAAVLFATVTPGLILTASDFLVV